MQQKTRDIEAAEAKLAKIAALETYYYHGAGDFYRKADITPLLKAET